MKLSLSVLAGAVLLAGTFVSAEDKKPAETTPPLLKHEKKSLTGKKVDLAKYNGK
ncbi:MAG: glutathione peroxidase, partial [Planctomycetaceae bacterium]|nr:glutathione peroxidase [Planctomycetaceae bacterium]